MKLWPNFAPVQNRISGVKTHYLRGRDAGHFGRWLGARSDVIRSASLRVAAKIAAGFAEGLDRIPRYALLSSPFSCPAGDFSCNAARGNNEF